jgi:hypothetical protein
MSDTILIFLLFAVPIAIGIGLTVLKSFIRSLPYKVRLLIAAIILLAFSIAIHKLVPNFGSGAKEIFAALVQGFSGKGLLTK